MAGIGYSEIDVPGGFQALQDCIGSALKSALFARDFIRPFKVIIYQRDCVKRTLS